MRFFVLAAALLSAPVQARAQPAQVEPVVVSGIGNPELKSYRVMSAGLDAFEDHRELAPTAKELRFRLVPRASAPADALDNLTLDIIGDSAAISVPVDKDGSFVLPRSDAAKRDNADLMLNKKKGNYRWKADVRSAGVPAGMRRLGDLRLECKVMVAVAKEEMGFWIKSMINTLLVTTDWCSHRKLRLATVSEGRIAAATVASGGRRAVLEVRPDGERYIPPLGDKSWPDDALIEFIRSDTAPAAPAIGRW